MPKKTLISEEDKKLFRKTVKTVRPIKKSKRVFFETEKPKPERLKKQTIEKPLAETYPSPKLSDPNELKIGPNTPLFFHDPSLPFRQLRKLRRGQIQVNAELDLHHMTIEVAREQLIHFIHDSSEKGYRYVRIAHGRGQHSGSDFPKLKNYVNYWLPQFHEVLAFHSAAPKEGGYGAVNVLLRSSSRKDN